MRGRLNLYIPTTKPHTCLVTGADFGTVRKSAISMLVSQFVAEKEFQEQNATQGRSATFLDPFFNFSRQTSATS
jgi:hypothetical protein